MTGVQTCALPICSRCKVEILAAEVDTFSALIQQNVVVATGNTMTKRPAWMTREQPTQDEIKGDPPPFGGQNTELVGSCSCSAWAASLWPGPNTQLPLQRSLTRAGAPISLARQFPVSLLGRLAPNENPTVVCLLTSASGKSLDPVLADFVARALTGIGGASLTCRRAVLLLLVSARLLDTIEVEVYNVFVVVT